MAAVIGALRVVLGADTAALEKGLKGAQSKLSSFADTAAKAGVAIAAAMSVAAIAIGVAIKKTIDEADKMGKMAQSIGIPVEELSRLKHAADLSDVSMETLARSVGRLSRNMSEAAQGGTSEATRAFQALGVSVTNSDGTLKNASVVMTEVAGKFGNFKDGAEKTALALAIFGRAGADLIPMLNSGAEGLRAMMREADELGVVIDSRTSKAAEAFNDNLTRMRKIWDGLVLKVTAEMLPAFQHLSQVLLDASKNSDLLKTAANGLVGAIKIAISAAVTAAFVFQRLGAELNALWGVLVAPNWEQMKAAWSNFVNVGKETEERFGKLKEFMNGFWNDVATTAETNAPATSEKIAAPIIQSAENIQKSMMEMKDAARAALDDIVNSPTEPIQAKLDALRQAVDNGTISWRAYGAAVRRVNQDSMNQITDLASLTANTLTSVFKDNKAAAVASAIINTAVSITKALSAYPPPISFAMAGLHAAAGAAQIAAIRSATPGFATGGSFRVGGSGGPDSQQVSFRATPGEMVDIRHGNDSGRGGNSVAMTVQFVGPIGDKELIGRMRDVAMQAVGVASRAWDKNMLNSLAQRQALQG